MQKINSDWFICPYYLQNDRGTKKSPVKEGKGICHHVLFSDSFGWHRSLGVVFCMVSFGWHRSKRVKVNCTLLSSNGLRGGGGGGKVYAMLNHL